MYPRRRNRRNSATRTATQRRRISRPNAAGTGSASRGSVAGGAAGAQPTAPPHLGPGGPSRRGAAALARGGGGAPPHAEPDVLERPRVRPAARRDPREGAVHEERLVREGEGQPGPWDAFVPRVVPSDRG